MTAATDCRLLAALPTAIGRVELYAAAGTYATRREYLRADSGAVAVSVIVMDTTSAAIFYADCQRRGSVSAPWPAEVT